MRGAEQIEWLRRLKAEHDNLSLALQWCRTTNGDAELGLELATKLHWFWEMGHFFAEGYEHLKALLERAYAVSPELRAQALVIAGRLAWRLGKGKEACKLLDESLNLAETLSDKRLLADVLLVRGLVTIPKRQEDIRTALQLYREEQEDVGISDCLYQLYSTPHISADADEAVSCLEEARSRCDARGDAWGYAHAVLATADWIIWTRRHNISEDPQQMQRANALLEEAFDRFVAVGERWGVRNTMLQQMNINFYQQNYQAVETLLGSVLEECTYANDGWGVGQCLGFYGELAFTEGGYERAARLLGAAAKLNHGGPHPRSYVDHAQSKLVLKHKLGEHEYYVATREGESIVSSNATEVALELLGVHPGNAPPNGKLM